ncbi:hypothetical protein [Actinokineospora diospyrosa]|uniref:HTH cro/C1-type domain-containing protein n=1 Tax=Actinokineospora diospyrosa TaxID=103728 RepID=A0ABT1INC9_9PSEU|nr:hypothetical protein [Actinokineospora diospyrosa]MCP2274184.1 hypothetical protein [Actinokineospora diospyrosa]
MASVGHWTGREASALRRALRLSVRAFAEHLGVAVRTVAKWEALKADTSPRPDTQAILDTALGRADTDATLRFRLLLSEPAGGSLARYFEDRLHPARPSGQNLTDESGSGLVSGQVFKLARRSTGLTQSGLAAALGVDLSAVQGWESGWQPLGTLRAGVFLRLSARLARLGSPASTGRHLREAVEADQVLSTAITAGGQWVDADTHPLAASVHRRSITNLITWPLTGIMPQHLAEFVSKAPTSTFSERPALSNEQVARFFDHLLTVAERGRGANEALLRRQAVYLLGFDSRPQVVHWLRDEWTRAGRQPVKDHDITHLLEARSASVALASMGEGTHLHDFVERTVGGGAEVANLNYWAYWIGELPSEQTSDEFMADSNTQAWVGARLLHHLTDRMVPGSPHLALNLHTLHALIASRPSLLAGPVAVRAKVTTALDQLSSAPTLTPLGRDQLAGLRYALRLASR